MLPQLILGALLVTFEVVFSCLLLHRKDITEISFIGRCTQWFLIVLLYVVLVLPIIHKYVRWDKRWATALYVIAVFTFAVVSAKLNINTVFSIEKVPMALLFYSLGYLVKRNDYTPRISRFMSRCWIFAIPTLIILSEINDPVGMYENRYGNLLLFMLTSIIGIAVCMFFSESLEDDYYLSLFGKYSIVVYCTHFTVIKFFRLALNYMLHYFLSKDIDTIVYPVYFVLFLLTMTTEVVVLNVWNTFWRHKNIQKIEE